MATIVVPPENRHSKEMILLGDISVDITDCDGNIVTIHGLTANDLVFKTVGGGTVNLATYIEQYAGVTPNVQAGVVTLSDGSSTTVQEMADDISYIQDSI